jgi:hypothetical protein
MTKAKNIPTNKDEAAAVEQPKPNHTAKIKSQVLAKIGKPPRLDRVALNSRSQGEKSFSMKRQVGVRHFVRAWKVR